MANEAPDHTRRLSRSLAHPAALLLLTAALTGLLVPWITFRWEAQDKRVEAARMMVAQRQLEASRSARNRELEVKAALLSRVGSASAKFLAALEVGVIDKSGPEARAEFRAIQIAGLEVGSQLAAYFPHSGPVARWRDFTSSLRVVYILFTTPPGRARNTWLDRLNRYLDLAPGQLAGLCFPSTSLAFTTDRRTLGVALQNKAEAIVSDIAASKTVLTGTPLKHFAVPLHYYDRTRRPCD